MPNTFEPAGRPTSGFGAFLDYMRIRGIGMEPPSSDAASSDIASRIVGSLGRGGPRDISVLFADAGSPSLSEFLRTLETLQQFGLVVRDGQAGEETFRLSPAGERTSRVITPLLAAE